MREAHQAHDAFRAHHRLAIKAHQAHNAAEAAYQFAVEVFSRVPAARRERVFNHVLLLAMTHTGAGQDEVEEAVRGAMTESGNGLWFTKKLFRALPEEQREARRDDIAALLAATFPALTPGDVEIALHLGALAEGGDPQGLSDALLRDAAAAGTA